jgi:hypothetical protein
VGDGVSVGVAVGGIGVGVAVGGMGVGVSVGVSVGVGVPVGVSVGVSVGVRVAVGVGVTVGVLVAVADGGGVGVCVGIGVTVGVAVGVPVIVGVMVGVSVAVGDGVAVGVGGGWVASGVRVMTPRLGVGVAGMRSGSCPRRTIVITISPRPKTIRATINVIRMGGNSESERFKRKVPDVFYLDERKADSVSTSGVSDVYS